MNLSTFQIVLLFVFGFLIIAAVFIFSGIIPIFDSNDENQFAGTVEAWGSIPDTLVRPVLDEIGLENEEFFNISYRFIVESQLESTLVEALANGTGPDAVIWPSYLYYRHSGKFLALPNSFISARKFKDTFVQAGEILLEEDGVGGLPVLVDPVVMYWNRDLLSSAGLASPPATWDELLSVAPKLTERGAVRGELRRSAVALGSWGNITHAKEIILSMILQTGELPQEMKDGSFSAISFFARFSNPLDSVYSWSTALPNSLNSFASGDLAIYFGLASDAESIKAKNPHLNFDVAPLPLLGDRPRLNFANVYSFSILKNSTRPTATVAVGAALTDEKYLEKLSTNTGIPPARRALLASSRAAGSDLNEVFYAAALAGRSWPDPDPASTSNILRGMIESVTSGRLKVPTAARDAAVRISDLYSEE